MIIFELLFTTGIRVGELCSIHEKDIDLESGEILIHGKGSRERLVQICHPDVLNILRLYVSTSKIKIEKSGYILINNRENKLSDQSVRNIVHKFVFEAIGKDATPHMFRHSFATLLLEENVDIMYIQKALGHSSITTTQRYIHTSYVKQRDIMTEKHPRNRIDINE